MKWVATIGAAALLAVGCVGAAPLEHAEVDLEGTVEREVWEQADPGCEDVDYGGLTVMKVEGEPSLGALVNDDGDVRCIDGLSLLLVEAGLIIEDPLASDPTPQPSHPGVAAARHGVVESARNDPTPTPLVRAHRADPTPTPMSQGDREDPTPTPMTEE